MHLLSLHDHSPVGVHSLPLPQRVSSGRSLQTILRIAHFSNRHSCLKQNAKPVFTYVLTVLEQWVHTLDILWLALEPMSVLTKPASHQAQVCNKLSAVALNSKPRNKGQTCYLAWHPCEAFQLHNDSYETLHINRYFALHTWVNTDHLKAIVLQVIRKHSCLCTHMVQSVSIWVHHSICNQFGRCSAEFDVKHKQSGTFPHLTCHLDRPYATFTCTHV